MEKISKSIHFLFRVYSCFGFYREIDMMRYAPQTSTRWMYNKVATFLLPAINSLFAFQLEHAEWCFKLLHASIYYLSRSVVHCNGTTYGIIFLLFIFTQIKFCWFLWYKAMFVNISAFFETKTHTSLRIISMNSI